jgi:hypothetical protein
MQKLVFITCLLGAVATLRAAPLDDPATTLRECVRQAASPAEVTVCEQRARRALQQRIERLEQAIFDELGKQQRPIFERNIAAWQAFVKAEQAMFTLSFGARNDRLGGPLQVGAMNQILEQRAEQLGDYLASLKH